MKTFVCLLASAAFLYCQASSKVELTFKSVGTKKLPQSKIFLVVGSKTTPITTIMGTAFGDSLITDRSWIPAKSVSNLGAISGHQETQMYVLHQGHDYQVYVRSLTPKSKKGDFRLFKTVKG